MKIRTDYVTNSSSSSFILAFNENDRWKSWEYFREICEEYDYSSFLDLITDCKSQSNNEKTDALDSLLRQYTHDYKWELLEQELDKNDKEYYVKCSRLEEEPNFQAHLVEYAEQNPEYVKKRQQIEDADFIVSGTIWDSNGGLLEWAIRNGFIRENFRGFYVTQWDVG